MAVIKIPSGNKIVLDFPEELYLPEGSKYNKDIQLFTTLGVSPFTIMGLESALVCTYEKFKTFLALRKAHLTPITPRFSEFLKQLVDDGVRILPNHIFVDKQDRFRLDLLIKLSNEEYLTEMPDGVHGSLDAENNKRTWEQWIDDVKGGVLYHENATHKFTLCYSFGFSELTENEYYALFNNLDLLRKSDFDLLSVDEMNAQIQTDSE
jgi:hypothetical protein